MSINVLGALRAWGLTVPGVGVQTTPLLEPGSEKGGGAPAPPSSVTLSAEARVLARFAEHGLSVSMHALEAPLQSGRVAQVQPYEQASAFMPVERDKLEALFAELGASAEEVQTLVQGFDVDGDQSLSHDELLNGLARSMKDGDSPFAQTLMRVMDRLGQADGSVSQREFVTLETRLLMAGQGRA